MTVILKGGPQDGQIKEHANERIQVFDVPPGGAPKDGIHVGDYVPTGKKEDSHDVLEWQPNAE